MKAIPPLPLKTKVKVVLFSGGRGSEVLSKELINNYQIVLTLAINGYDDGASTGEIRRFLGDILGPSDFRKNASRLARELYSCPPACVDLLDLRFPQPCSEAEARACFRIIQDSSTTPGSEFQTVLKSLLSKIDDVSRASLAGKLGYFEDELSKTKRVFTWSDCSIGNLVFAGCFLEVRRNFNSAISLYCSLLNLPSGLIENVTTGANACLVAIAHDNGILGSEAEIVDASNPNYLKDIYLIDHPLTDEEKARLTTASASDIASFFETHATDLTPNPCLLDKIAEADLIIYAPGTQHSSLFPSYLTPGIGTTIAQNLTALKLLITNIQEDAEIPESSAVDIIDRAVYYLRQKDTIPHPLPCLITHYLINDPNRQDDEITYIPLGRLEDIEDPRLVRIGNYEEGTTGQHNAQKVLAPFIKSILENKSGQRIGVFLLNTNSLNKVSQSILEILRAGVQYLPQPVEVFYRSVDPLDPDFLDLLPFNTHRVSGGGVSTHSSFLKILAEQPFEYVVLFDSSGRYKGEDIVNLVSLLNNGRLDAVWGSRRLSVEDIHQSYRRRYRHNVLMGAISYIGSHLLSLAYLVLYGRYISDTLSGVRAIRACYLRSEDLNLAHKNVNQHILSTLLRNRAEIFESPVQFFPAPRENVERTRLLDGFRALLAIPWWRFKPTKRVNASKTSPDRGPPPAAWENDLSDQ